MNFFNGKIPLKDTIHCVCTQILYISYHVHTHTSEKTLHGTHSYIATQKLELPIKEMSIKIILYMIRKPGEENNNQESLY